MLNLRLYILIGITWLVSLLISCNEPQLFGNNNAVWTESIYLRGYNPSSFRELTNDQIKSYAHTLKSFDIRYAYLFAGPYGEDGHLPAYAFSKKAQHTVQRLKAYYPGIQILPWIGGIQNKTVYLEDSLWVRNAVADTKKLIEVLQIPGVHIDFEYIIPGEPYLQEIIDNAAPGGQERYGTDVNEFHRKLRKAIPQAFISSVVVATSPGTRPWKRKTTLSELKSLVKYIDQLSFLYYDTYISDQKLFESNCRRLILDIQSLKKERDIQYLIAIGTFINPPELQKYRNLRIENIPNTLSVIKHQIRSVNSSERIVDGIAIFCDWETDLNEWHEFRNQWAKENL